MFCNTFTCNSLQNYKYCLLHSCKTSELSGMIIDSFELFFSHYVSYDIANNNVKKKWKSWKLFVIVQHRYVVLKEGRRQYLQFCRELHDESFAKKSQVWVIKLLHFVLKTRFLVILRLVAWKQNSHYKLQSFSSYILCYISI